MTKRTKQVSTKVLCFGIATSLDMESLPEDSALLAKQLGMN
jgi:hypothetical protein